MSKLRLAIHGAAGRMGRRVVALAAGAPDMEVVAALESSSHPELGKDAGQLAGVGTLEVPLSSSLTADASCLIDFSVAEAADRVVALAGERKLPLVMATTGLDERQQAEVKDLGSQVPVLWAPNMSLAVNLTMKLATIAGDVLRQAPGGADVEIIDRHHRFKKDAPSGTALRFGELISAVMGQTDHTHGRHGIIGERPRSEIGYHALRVGDNPGEHTIVFGMLGESVELTVRATNRDCYALAALGAARFLVTQSPGVYSMTDVLGL